MRDGQYRNLPFLKWKLLLSNVIGMGNLTRFLNSSSLFLVVSWNWKSELNNSWFDWSIACCYKYIFLSIFNKSWTTITETSSLLLFLTKSLGISIARELSYASETKYKLSFTSTYSKSWVTVELEQLFRVIRQSFI